MGLCVSTYGMSCLGSQLFALDLVHIGFFPSLHGFLHIGSILSIYGISCLGFLLPTLDSVQMGSFLPLQGSS